MKRIFIATIAIVTAISSLVGNESKCKDIARREYPNDARMQEYIYKNQLAAYRYIKTTAKDSDVMKIALHEYPNDYSMQKYTYDKQLSAKDYMMNQPNNSAKKKALREYPKDYSMQKYIYDRAL